MPTLHPHCPSCRYDLSGNVAAWTDACPLRGVCSECGRHFDWREIFADPDRHIRIFDAAPRPGLYELGGSLLLALLHPRRFWQIAAAQPLAHPGRLALITPLAVGIGGSAAFLFVFVLSIPAAVVTYLLWDRTWFYEVFDALWLLGTFVDGYLETFVSPWPLVPFALFAAAMVAWVGLATTFRRAGATWRTAIRSCAWFAIWMPLPLAVWGVGGIASELAYDASAYGTPAAALAGEAMSQMIWFLRGPATALAAVALFFLWWREAFLAHGVRQPGPHAAALTALAVVIGGAGLTIISLLALAAFDALWW